MPIYGGYDWLADFDFISSSIKEHHTRAVDSLSEQALREMKGGQASVWAG